MPSGDVAPVIGVGVTDPSNAVSACARAALQKNCAARITAVDTNLIGIFRLPTESRRQAPTSVIFATGLAVRLSDIGQSLKSRRSFGTISGGRWSISGRAPRPVCVVGRRTPKVCVARLRSLASVAENLRRAAARERPVRGRAPRMLIQRAGLRGQSWCLKSERLQGSSSKKMDTHGVAPECKRKIAVFCCGDFTCSLQGARLAQPIQLNRSLLS